MAVAFTFNDTVKILSYLDALETTLTRTNDWLTSQADYPPSLFQVHVDIIISHHRAIAINLEALLALTCFPQYNHDFLGLVAHEAQVRWFTEVFEQLRGMSDEEGKQVRQMTVLSTMRNHYTALSHVIRRAQEFFHYYLRLGAGSIVTFNCTTQLSVIRLEDSDDEDEITQGTNYSTPVVVREAAATPADEEEEEEDPEPTQQGKFQDHRPATVVGMRSGRSVHTPPVSSVDDVQDKNRALSNLDHFHSSQAIAI